LADIIWQYGEERNSRRIAAVLIRMRQSRRLERTDDLAEAVRRVVKGPMVVKSLARVFQAFRIFVNGELDNLQHMLPQAVAVLKPERRGVIISYHSLEDRITKRFIREAIRPCICPPQLPVCVCQRKPILRAVDNLIMADEAEQELNKSSRSARLRVFEKI
jgi:16S rRNA (cytosine1402-N4)-methyltransferase